MFSPYLIHSYPGADTGSALEQWHRSSNFLYRVTHNGWDFKRRLYGIWLVRFVAFWVPCRIKLNLVYSCKINQQNTQFNANTKTQVSNRQIFELWAVFTVLSFVGNPIYLPRSFQFIYSIVFKFKNPKYKKKIKWR